jgi:hypothetical protein
VNIDSDFNARGYRFTTGGFDLGFDYRFLDHFAIGLMGGYAHTWVDLRPGTITVNAGRGGLYATYFTGGFYINGGIYGGYDTYDSSRRALRSNRPRREVTIMKVVPGTGKHTPLGAIRRADRITAYWIPRLLPMAGWRRPAGAFY